MKQMPQVQKFMTAMPHTIGVDIPIRTAIDMMREFHIRHLPVLDGGKLVGVLSDRDVKLAISLDDSQKFNAGDVMMPDPYTVKPEAFLDQVVMEMANHKYGCAVIEQSNGKVVGIFTATDGLAVLGETLQAFYRNKL